MLRELAPELETSAPGRLSSTRLPSLSAVIRIGSDDRPGMFRFADVMKAGGKQHVRLLHELQAFVAYISNWNLPSNLNKLVTRYL